jgi:lipoate-protein ligase B
VDVCETPRGGEATLHAPGQLVLYPVVKVGRQIRAHIIRMADATIALLAEEGIGGLEFRMEHPGVWLGARKIASIGIHVSRGVTVQGMSVNVDVDPPLFDALVSCGMPEVELTSLAQLASGPVPAMPTLARRWAEHYAELGGFELRWDREEHP